MINEQLIEHVHATYEDLPAIVDIYNSSIPGRRATADTQPVSVQDKEAWFHAHSPDSRPLWVLKYNGTVCAWLSFQSFYGRPAYQATCEVSLYVADGFRSQHLGRYMFKRAIEECPRLGVKTLVGYVFSHNEASLKLCSSFGFETWGKLPKIAELDGVERDLTIVGKRVY